MKTVTVLNRKEKNIVFNSINFNLWIELNSNPIELRWIKLHYANSSISLHNLNILSNNPLKKTKMACVETWDWLSEL